MGQNKMEIRINRITLEASCSEELSSKICQVYGNFSNPNEIGETIDRRLFCMA